jgi:hypothetical protein
MPAIVRSPRASHPIPVGLPVVALAIAAVVLAPSVAPAQSTSFTYQGKLTDAGSPVAGSVDLVFRVFDADAGGTQYGADLSLAGVAVQDGLFTVELDFGPGVFDESPRWLEVEVNLAPLSPRQQVTGTPFAQTSNDALHARGPWITSAPDLYFTDGNVGIGTVVPTARLDIGGAPGVDGIRFPDGSLQTTAAIGMGGDSIWSLNGINAYYNAGNVGIGTSAPDGKVNITGGPVWTSNGWTKALNINNLHAVELGGGSSNKFGLGTSGGTLYYFQTSAVGAEAAANYYMAVNPGGNILLGTIAGTAAAAKLDIAATGDGISLLRFSTERPWTFRQAYTGSGTALRLQPDTGLKNFEITAAGGTNVATFVGDDANPRVGIGTLNPTSTLHSVSVLSSSSAVYGQSAAGTAVAGVFGRSDATNGNGVIGEAPTGAAAYGVWGRATQGIGGVFSGGNLALWAQGRARVGILEITGGADFSENFDVVDRADGAADDVTPGMIVCIDGRTPGKLVVSRTPYDRTVAGIISGAGGVDVGMTMGQAGTLADGKHPVALTGRVYAWCDATGAAIEPGDMLTTSTTPGHAMTASDRDRSHGAVIGKAMTRLARGERGLVLVLVNLQ